MRFHCGYLALILSFLLGCQDGFVAIWKIPDKTPAVIFPYSVSSLPPADRQRLQQGIRVDTREELMQLLEDYLS